MSAVCASRAIRCHSLVGIGGTHWVFRPVFSPRRVSGAALSSRKRRAASWCRERTTDGGARLRDETRHTARMTASDAAPSGPPPPQSSGKGRPQQQKVLATAAIVAAAAVVKEENDAAAAAALSHAAASGGGGHHHHNHHHGI